MMAQNSSEQEKFCAATLELTDLSDDFHVSEVVSVEMLSCGPWVVLSHLYWPFLRLVAHSRLCLDRRSLPHTSTTSTTYRARRPRELQGMARPLLKIVT